MYITVTLMLQTRSPLHFLIPQVHYYAPVYITVTELDYHKRIVVNIVAIGAGVSMNTTTNTIWHRLCPERAWEVQ